MNIFTAPFVNALFGSYYLVGNLGWAVVIVTVVIRLLLLPLLLPSLKAAKKTRELQPRLKKLQEKYKGNKEALAKAQMDFYKQEGVNPLSGCLPQILQIAVLLLFFAAFNQVTGFASGNGELAKINSQLIPSFQIDENFRFETIFMGNGLEMTPATEFAKDFGMNMALPIFLLIGSALLQFFSSKLMMPAVKADKNVVKKTEDKEDDMMSAMRTQSMYMMPAFTLFIGWNFSLGILLYWFVNSGVMLIQQILVEKFQKDEKKG